MADPLAARLEHFVSTRLARPVHLLSLDRSTEGFSAETFSFTVDDGGLVRGYVLKREPVAGLLEPYDLEPEFRVLHALSDDPLPSPPTPWFERDPGVLERPFYVMERLPGDVPIPGPGEEMMGPFTASERTMLAPAIVGALAALHAIDVHRPDLAFLPHPGADAAAQQLDVWRARIDRAGFPMEPALAEALGWLGRSLPRTDEVGLVHGDYRLGNFLVTLDGGARLTGILDWEMVHLGDPLEDVAWCISPLWRGGSPLASGLATPEEFVERYAAATGRPVDRDRLGFYEVLSVVKMMAIMLTGLRAFVDGRTDDIRMAIFDHQLPMLRMMLGMTRGWLGGS